MDEEHLNHDDDCNCAEYDSAREKLAETIRKAVGEFLETMGEEEAVVIASTLVVETTRFDNAGLQNYATKHWVLDGSLATAVGLLTVAKGRLTDYVAH